jgi:hypothetical protein
MANRRKAVWIFKFEKSLHKRASIAPLTYPNVHLFFYTAAYVVRRAQAIATRTFLSENIDGTA